MAPHNRGGDHFYRKFLIVQLIAYFCTPNFFKDITLLPLELQDDL
jgi:hypothetical protein